jgi:ketosteroid isomerase-like protein
MPEHLSPRQVVEILMQRISDEKWQEIARLYADDAVIEYPFALPAPMRIEGIEAIRGYFATAATWPLKLQTRHMVVRETANPEIVVAEWDYDGLVTTTGRSFRVSNIQVSTIRNSKIVASRDYHNHAVLADAMGRLPALFSAMTSSTPGDG